MLPRVLEPEVMDTEAEAVDYNAMDHSEVNRRFVDDLLAQRVHPEAETDSPLTVLDVGTGTALIPIELCRRNLSLHVTAVDLAAHMLQLGQRNVIRAGLQSAIRLEQIDAKQLPYANGEFPWVMSNSIVHHVPDPAPVLADMWRVVKPSGLWFVRDLLRPADEPTLQHLVATYAGDANAHQRQMFADSLHAALTLDEVRRMVTVLGIAADAVQQTTDRHWTLVARKSNT